LPAGDEVLQRGLQTCDVDRARYAGDAWNRAGVQCRRDSVLIAFEKPKIDAVRPLKIVVIECLDGLDGQFTRRSTTDDIENLVVQRIHPLSGPIAVRLPDGRVLVSGGGNRCGEIFSTAALFDPGKNTWTTTAAMTVPRAFHSALVLADGRVLVAGSATSEPSPPISAEIYDPASSTWSVVGNAERLEGTKNGPSTKNKGPRTSRSY